MKWKFIFLVGWMLSMFYADSLSAQITCTGTFGDNIFGQGDFGSGSENIVSNVTGIAPGYTYTSQTPPSDGYYTITNDMGKWTNNYGTWISVGDHSNDPNGYMMVVNASYAPGKFYEQTIDSLCPNTTFEFSADIINVVSIPTTGHSLPDLEFLIDDSVRYSTGTIPQDEKWHKHGFTFSLEPGQTSIKLTLVNKAPGGTGNDLALDNITFRPCGPEPDPELERELYFCEDNILPGSISTNIDTSQFYIQWQTTRIPGLNWQNTGGRNKTSIVQDLDAPGTYYYRYKVSNSLENLDNLYCVSLSEIVTAEVLPLEYELRDTICMGNSRRFNGQVLTDRGEYTASFTSLHGCDSIVTLHLEVVEKSRVEYDLLAGNPLCHDSADGIIEVSNTRGGYSPYEYILDGDTNRTGRFENLAAGIKHIEIVDHFGCAFMEEVELVNPPRFELDPFRDTQLILGQPLTIDIAANQPVSTVRAVPDILQDCMDCSTVTFIPTGSSEVMITATNQNGCLSTEKFYIEVNDDDLPISFPNAFSPNGDGVNDDLRIIAPPYLIQSIRSARILDRWGNVVYDMSGGADSFGAILWDGQSGLQMASPGVYAYMCEVELINTEVRLFWGEVTLIK